MGAENFPPIIDFTARAEGRVNGFIGYVNHPRDPGGETCCGISRKYWPAWAGWAIVDRHKTGILPGMISSGTDYDRALARDMELWKLIQEFYKKAFWDTSSLDSINSARAALLIFDSTILIGGEPRKWAQAVTNDLSNYLAGIAGAPVAWPPLKVDGGIGPASALSMNALFTKTVNGRPADLAWGIEFLNRRERFHRERCAQDPSQDVFLAGWINRCDTLRRRIGA